MKDKDSEYMRLALELAQKGYGYVAPNPLVGAVVVKEDRIIGQGWHERFGQPHAERNALAACIEDAENFMQSAMQSHRLQNRQRVRQSMLRWNHAVITVSSRRVWRRLFQRASGECMSDRLILIRLSGAKA